MEYDFYNYGLRVAEEEKENLYNIANGVKRDYGQEAYNEFMMGAEGRLGNVDPYENTPEGEIEDIFNNTTKEKIMNQAEEGYVNNRTVR